jgi:hypothetical protein
MQCSLEKLPAGGSFRAIGFDSQPLERLDIA